MTKPATGAALVLHGVGKRYRLGRSRGLVPVPLFGDRLERLERERRRDAEDDEELEEDEDEELDGPEERRTTGPTRELWALRDVDLVVQPGEAVGVVGLAGSGKSTLMKVVGRITPPTEGRIEVRGRVAPVLGSLSGFLVADATARANVGILARFLGVPHDVAARNLESILHFAELEDLGHMKVKHLSRGMRDRLAYTVGLHFEPDVLLADDRVVAGDPPFQERCLARIEALLAEDTALVFASNRLRTVTDLCTHGLWLEGGRVRAHGRVDEVVDAYRESLRPPEPAPEPPPPPPEPPPSPLPPPPAAEGAPSADAGAVAGPEPEPEPVTIAAAGVLTRDGQPTAEARAGDTVIVETDVDVHEGGRILTGSLSFARGDERTPFIAPSPHAVDVPGRYVLHAQVTLDGLAPGDYVGRAAVVVNHLDGRTSTLVRSKPFRFSIGPAAEDAGRRADRPTASWTVMNFAGELVASPPPLPPGARRAVGGALRRTPKRRGDDASARLERLREELAELARGDGPVLAGPFVGTVAFELLYWLPFVRWAVEQEPGLRGRLVLISRGGTASWAADLDAAGYVDVLSLVSPEELLRRRPSVKQREVSAFDQELLAAVRDHLGVRDAAVLHPSLLFDLYYRVVKLDRRAFAAAVTPTDGGASGLAASYRPIPWPGQPPAEAGLPDDYVAVRFHGPASLPDSEENQALVRRLVANLADKVPVVLLGHDFDLDDHSDIGAGHDERIFSVAHLMRPADSLDVQTRVLAGARGFVGTYGGLSYLAPSLGLPSVALFSSLERLQPGHPDLAQQVFALRGFGSLAFVTTADSELLDLAFGGLAQGAPGLSGRSP